MQSSERAYPSAKIYTREVCVRTLPQRVGYTLMFLRMTEKEMRELAERTPDIGRELQHIADALNAEAKDLAKHVSQ